MSMTTTVTADGPPAPGRKPSVFEKMFDGFKFGDKKDGQNESRPTTSEGSMDEKSKSTVEVKETPSSLAPPFSINETRPLEEPKRSLSVALVDVFRRGSESSNKSRNSSPTRKMSGSSLRKHSLFHSSNPDPEMDIPARNHSIQSHTSSTSYSAEGMSRKNSYVPRNASTSFLHTATIKSETEKDKIRASISNASGTGRNASVALSDTSETSTATSYVSTRRPSGMVPNNVAARYMRSASLAEEEKNTDGATTASRRRPSGNKSRQNSNGESTSVKPVTLAPEQYQQWQNSVSKSLRGVPFNKPGEALERHRMQSLAGIADVAEVAEESESNATPPRSQSSTPTFNLNVQPASPPRDVGSGRAGSRGERGAVRKQFSIDTMKANGATGGDRGRMDSGRPDVLADQVSPKNMTFGIAITGTERKQGGARQEGENEANPELESLGFHGAVPA